MTAPNRAHRQTADELADVRDEVQTLPSVAGAYVSRSDVLAALRRRIDRLNWEDTTHDQH